MANLYFGWHDSLLSRRPLANAFGVASAKEDDEGGYFLILLGRSNRSIGHRPNYETAELARTIEVNHARSRYRRKGDGVTKESRAEPAME